jgi:hypothetical protein
MERAEDDSFFIFQCLLEMLLALSFDLIDDSGQRTVVITKIEHVVKDIDEKPNMSSCQVCHIILLCPRKSPHPPFNSFSQRGREGDPRQQGAEQRYTPRGKIGYHSAVYAEKEKGNHCLKRYLSSGRSGIPFHALLSYILQKLFDGLLQDGMEEIRG